MVESSRCPICGEQVAHVEADAHRVLHRLGSDPLSRIADDVRSLRNLVILLIVVVAIAAVFFARGLS